MIDIARNIVPCSDKQDMKSRNGSYFQPSFSTRKRQRISSDLFSELPQKRSKTTNGRIWNKATYSFSSQILCTISSKVIRMWASFTYICLLLTIKFEYMENISRRTAIKTFLAGGVALATTGIEAAAAAKKKTDVKEPLKGNVRHSVSKWCFGDYKLDEFCEICKHIGIESVELLDPVDWPIVQKHGLTVAMAQGAGLGIDRGFNDPALHDELVASYEKVIPMVADAGLTNLICFSGRRNGVTDLQGGSPGRAEIDETQELYYPAIIKALMETGYKGFVGQEFVPAQEDKIASLEKCIRICDV